MTFYKTNKARLDQPLSCASLQDIGAYTAVFVPGGHGAMLGLPENGIIFLSTQAFKSSFFVNTTSLILDDCLKIKNRASKSVLFSR